MEHKLPKGYPWILKMTQHDEPDPASIWVVSLFVHVDRQASLTGRVVAHGDDPPFVEKIFSNELLLPKRDAERLLRRLWEEYYRSAMEFDSPEMEMMLDLEQWLADRYEDGGKEVMGYVQTTLRTFA